MLVLGSRVGKSGAGSVMVRASTGVALGGGPLVDGHVGLAGDRRRVSGDCRTGSSATSYLTCRAPAGSASKAGLGMGYWGALDTALMCTVV